MRRHTPHGKHMDKHPADVSKHHDLATTKKSQAGKFTVSITSKLDPVAINKMHSWVVEVKSPDGKPVENAKIGIDGGMPMHGHGLPTAPSMTKYLGRGQYLVEGMKFNMAGLWELKLAIDSGHNQDSVTFNLYLK